MTQAMDLVEIDGYVPQYRGKGFYVGGKGGISQAKLRDRDCDSAK